MSELNNGFNKMSRSNIIPFLNIIIYNFYDIAVRILPQYAMVSIRYQSWFTNEIKGGFGITNGNKRKSR